MTDLPARPSLDHLRRQARDLLRDAQADDTTGQWGLDYHGALAAFPRWTVRRG